jgi:hypothetical protein
MTATPAGVVKSSDDSVTEADPPSFADVADALREAGSVADPAEAHGSLCGLSCLLGGAAHGPWLADTVGAESLAGREVLAALATGTTTALNAADPAFTPLLPPDHLILAVRTRALADWCHGFAHGLAAAAGNDPRAYEGVVGEVLGDFGELARASVEADETGEEGEAAYAELVEFVRVGAQLVYAELAPLRPAGRAA